MNFSVYLVTDVIKTEEGLIFTLLAIFFWLLLGRSLLEKNSYKMRLPPLTSNLEEFTLLATFFLAVVGGDFPV